MRFCTKCGTQNTDEAQVCIQCQSYLSNTNNRNNSIKPNVLIAILGLINGIASIILGIITFCMPSLRQDTVYILEKELGDESETFIDLFLSPSKAFSFGMGSLLVVLGLFICFYFVNLMIQKRK